MQHLGRFQIRDVSSEDIVKLKSPDGYRRVVEQVAILLMSLNRSLV